MNTRTKRYSDLDHQPVSPHGARWTRKITPKRYANWVEIPKPVVVTQHVVSNPTVHEARSGTGGKSRGHDTTFLTVFGTIP